MPARAGRLGVVALFADEQCRCPRPGAVRAIGRMWRAFLAQESERLRILSLCVAPAG